MISLGAPSVRSATTRDRENDAAEILGAVRRELACEASLLVPPRNFDDDVSKVLLRNGRERRSAVMYISSPAAPEMVANCMSITRSIQAALGPKLGEVVLTPIAEGVMSGRSYAIVALCRRPAGRAGKRLVRSIIGPLVFAWLQDAVAATAMEAGDDEVARLVVEPLEHLVTLRGMNEQLTRAARQAISRIETGRWKPRLTLEHGDMWFGNVLLPPAQWRGTLLRRVRRPFVLVDWYGARLRSPGMYDLVRFARSLRIRPHQLRRHVLRHCSASRLACDPLDAAGALAASLGSVAMHLGQFPMARFAPMAESCYRSLTEAMDAT